MKEEKIVPDLSQRERNRDRELLSKIAPVEKEPCHQKFMTLLGSVQKISSDFRTLTKVFLHIVALFKPPSHPLSPK